MIIKMPVAPSTSTDTPTPGGSRPDMPDMGICGVCKICGIWCICPGGEWRSFVPTAPTGTSEDSSLAEPQITGSLNTFRNALRMGCSQCNTFAKDSQCAGYEIS